MALVAYSVLGALLHGSALLAPRNPPSRAGAVCASADESPHPALLPRRPRRRRAAVPREGAGAVRRGNDRQRGQPGGGARRGPASEALQAGRRARHRARARPGPNADAAARAARAAAPPDAAAAAPSADLEVEPYHAILPNLPLNTFKPKAPLAASIISAKRIVGADAPGEVCHVEIGTGGALRYWEGQSLGVVPPGLCPKSGKPNTVRLYSIASTRYGDDGAGTSVSLCVRRAATGTRRKAPRTRRRRASAPTSSATPSRATRSRSPAPPAR